jgi:CRP-like cAMP-binding protein
VAAIDKVALLKRSPVFGRLPIEALTLLAEMLQSEEFSGGTTVCETGEAADSVFIVGTGKLSVFVGSSAVRVRELAEGDVVGEYGMFGNRGRTATVRADTDAVLFSLDYQRFRDFLFTLPDAMWALFGVAVDRLSKAERRLLAPVEPSS